jgi:hypothetical protein
MSIVTPFNQNMSFQRILAAELLLTARTRIWFDRQMDAFVTLEVMVPIKT